MIKRFQIEDIIVQDTQGITFRALDQETGAMVAIHRFFPYGANEGGLHDEDQASYKDAISSLSKLSHPALRAVLGGGCDPIDGMPYIANEWVEGDGLQTIIERGPLPTEVAVVLLTQALEVCELLSQVFAEEAIWVETDLSSIILGKESSGRGFTFWISPLKWLGGDEQYRGFCALATLAEEITGGSNEAARKLGGWIKWLRGTPNTTRLQEIRERLAASVGAETPTSQKNPAANAMARPASSTSKIIPPVKTVKVVNAVRAEPSNQGKKFSTRTKWMMIALPLLMMAGLGEFWLLGHRARQKQATDGAAGQVRGSTQDFSGGNDTVTTGEIIPWDDTVRLTQSSKKTVTIEGVAKQVSRSVSGKTIYLLFADDSDKSTVRAGMETNQESPAAIKKTFESFIGKKVHVTGTLAVLVTHGSSRPEVTMKNLSAIKAAD